MPTTDALVAGGFIGLLAAVAIYHLLLYTILRSSDLLAYGAYLLALVVFELAHPPYAGRVGLPFDHEWFFWWSFAVLATLGYWFFRSFLVLPEYQPRLNRIFVSATALVSAGSLAAPWLHAIQLPIKLASLAVLALAAVSLVIALGQGVRVARFFGIAYAGFFAGTLAFEGYSLGIAGPLFQYGVEIGSAFQALTLALGLADRIASANEERDHAQLATIAAVRSLNVAYARFVPRAFLDLLGIDDVRNVRLGDGVEREMTVLFSDVRSFTSISEAMAPREIFGFINTLLTHTGPVIREHGGIVDKYVGDAIMALFPRGADDALAAAIGVQAAVAALNVERATRAEPPIAVGVGLHCGSLMLGTIGEAERMDGTVIADAVNVASRMEGLTKTFATTIVVSEQVRGALRDPDAVAMRYLGRVAVAGTSRGIGIYEVLDGQPAARCAAKRANAPVFAEAVRAFVAGDFATAAAGFAAVVAADPADGPAAYLRGRSLALAENAVPWDGYDVATK